ncbi:uncharacterized protein si:ch211-176l24.4 [Pristis pectinata]|uniref:uncharacterized protein si:ch211-176l24.4 n=1 Tax=Pristis pectinata TaxID=685728 RepID=UPI00223DBCC0|nr:uncharacterized protein si:ch211-176l24.4 [Pristis pectinata]
MATAAPARCVTGDNAGDVTTLRPARPGRPPCACAASRRLDNQGCSHIQRLPRTLPWARPQPPPAAQQVTPSIIRKMESRPVKRKQKAAQSPPGTPAVEVEEEGPGRSESYCKSTRQNARLVPDCEKLPDHEGVGLNQVSTKKAKRNKSSKRIRFAPQIGKDGSCNSFVEQLVKEVSEGRRKSSLKKKCKKSKKKEKDKKKEKYRQEKGMEKPNSVLNQHQAPKHITVCNIPAKSKRRKCLLGDCSLSGNLMGVRKKEHWEEVKCLRAVSDPWATGTKVHRHLRLPTPQEGLYSPANGKRMQQEEEPCAGWEKACCREKARQDALKERPAVSQHRRILNPFWQSLAQTSRPKVSLDESWHRYLGCLTGDPGSKRLRGEDEVDGLCSENSRVAHGVETNPEVTEDFVNSQDLFITQKTFLPLVQSNSTGSYLVEEMVEEDCNVMAGVLPSALDLPNSKLCDKGTQTADFFSSPAVATSLQFCQRARGEHCSQEPVDLSLPSRVRAKIDSDMKTSPNSLCPQECCRGTSHQGFVKSPDAPNTCQVLLLSPLSEGKRQGLKNSFILSQSRRSDDGKYVQTFLNESYFFKVKGQLKTRDPRAPLVRNRQKKQKI